MNPRTSGLVKVVAVLFCGSLIVLGIFLGIFGFLVFNRGDGIEVGRTYALAYTYKATIRGGSGTPARVFDFADRSLPRTSVVVPLQDDRGMSLVRENPSLPPSTVRKVVGSVPTQVVEGVTYSGYTYVVWQYNLGEKEPQSIVPVVTPRK